MNTNRVLEVRKQAGLLLHKVLSGEQSCEWARTHWPQHEKDTSLDCALHALYHYEDDADIRQRDAKYAQWQTSQLREMAETLVLGNDLDKRLTEWLTPRPAQ